MALLQGGRRGAEGGPLTGAVGRALGTEPPGPGAGRMLAPPLPPWAAGGPGTEQRSPAQRLGQLGGVND